MQGEAAPYDTIASALITSFAADLPACVEFLVFGVVDEALGMPKFVG